VPFPALLRHQSLKQFQLMRPLVNYKIEGCSGCV